jgi:hypothetical protein
MRCNLSSRGRQHGRQDGQGSFSGIGTIRHKDSDGWVSVEWDSRPGTLKYHIAVDKSDLAYAEPPPPDVLAKLIIPPSHPSRHVSAVTLRQHVLGHRKDVLTAQWLNKLAIRENIRRYQCSGVFYLITDVLTPVAQPTATVASLCLLAEQMDATGVEAMPFRVATPIVVGLAWLVMTFAMLLYAKCRTPPYPFHDRVFQDSFSPFASLVNFAHSPAVCGVFSFLICTTIFQYLLLLAKITGALSASWVVVFAPSLTIYACIPAGMRRIASFQCHRSRGCCSDASHALSLTRSLISL